MAGKVIIDEFWKNDVIDVISQEGSTHLRRAISIVSDHAVAEDICQQAYLKAIQKKDQIRDPSNLSGWIARVVTNAALDHLRRQKRQRRAYSVWGERAKRGIYDEERLMKAEMREELYGFLDRLDEPIRQVVVMRTIQGMTGKEVKQSLGCSAALVSKRLHKGLSQLRKWIKESDQEESVNHER